MQSLPGNPNVLQGHFQACVSHSLPYDVGAFSSVCQCCSESGAQIMECKLPVNLRIPPCLAKVLRSSLPEVFRVALGYRSVGRAEDVSLVSIGVMRTLRYSFPNGSVMMGRDYLNQFDIERNDRVGLSFLDHTLTN